MQRTSETHQSQLLLYHLRGCLHACSVLRNGSMLLTSSCPARVRNNVLQGPGHRFSVVTRSGTFRASRRPLVAAAVPVKQHTEQWPALHTAAVPSAAPAAADWLITVLRLQLSDAAVSAPANTSQRRHTLPKGGVQQCASKRNTPGLVIGHSSLAKPQPRLTVGLSKASAQRVLQQQTNILKIFCSNCFEGLPVDGECAMFAWPHMGGPGVQHQWHAAC